jgi:hypothetical protein
MPISDLPCSVEGCPEQRYKRLWCNAHYIRWRRHGDPLAGGEMRDGGPCKAIGCDARAIAARLCKLHYERRRIHGDENVAVKIVRRGMSTYDRIMAQTIALPSGCVVFTGHRNHGNYGIINDRGRHTGAHRVVLAHHQGPPQPGMQAMHSCDNPPCVNIDHLRWGTAAENMQDMVAKGRRRGGPQRKIP